MKAADVMTTDVVTAPHDATIRQVADLLVRHRISAAPVVDGDGRLIGLVSEGDLIQRAEIGTDARRSWWLEWLTSDEALAKDYVRSHTERVVDVMTRNVVTAAPETPLREVAALLEKHGIKRVPIVQGGKVVGIVSRANLVRALANVPMEASATSTEDRVLRERIEQRMRELPWHKPWLLTVNVQDGAAELWGPVDSESERQALRVAAETTPGVRSVTDNLYRLPPGSGV